MRKCYYCGRPADSNEHVPPQCLFPKRGDIPGDERDFRKNLITVPSCRKHNTEKSGDDLFLWYVMACSFPVNQIALQLVKGRMWRSVERKPALMAGMIRASKPVMIHDTIKKESYESGATPIDRDRLDSALIHVAKGLYFHCFGERWKKDIRVMPNFFAATEGEHAQEINRRLRQIYLNQERYFLGASELGENPEIFSYQLITPYPKTPTLHLVARLAFYEGNKVTVLFGDWGGADPERA